MSRHSMAACVCIAGFIAAGCSQPAAPPADAAKAPAGQPPAGAAAQPAAGAPQAAAPEEVPSALAALPEDMRSLVDKAFTGDLDQMIQRRIIRAGVPFNRTFFFIDKGQPRGISYELLALFEESINKKYNTGNLKVHVVLLPFPHDDLLPALNAGKVDLVAAQLTVTPERQALVDFTQPTRKGVDEIVVTGPGAPPLASANDLSGRQVFVRKSSSYFASLQELNKTLASAGKPPVDVQLASESLEDDDLLEMVNAGLIPATVVDNYLASFWKQVFTDLRVHESAKLRTGGNLAVAVRKNSPKFVAEVDSYIAKQGLNSAIGATLNKRYLVSTKYAKNATSETERKKFRALIDLFRKYGDKYDFDYLMMAAQGYQESRLDQNAKSAVGAIGVMQLMPETGREQKVGDVKQTEPNIHAGVKYMRFIRREFFDDQPMDDLNKALFTFAAYNAGPGRVRQLRGEAGKRGLNPNVWFGNVERIASERIGRETVTYVSNIYKYYVAYKLLSTQTEQKKQTKKATGGGMG